MLNDEFLNELLGKEDVSLDDKVKSIIAEHEADTRGLLAKRDELLGNEKKLKEKISGYESAKGEYESKISGLEEELKKATSDDHKKYYETQIADLKKSNEEALLKVSIPVGQCSMLFVICIQVILQCRNQQSMSILVVVIFPAINII